MANPKTLTDLFRLQSSALSSATFEQTQILAREVRENYSPTLNVNDVLNVTVSRSLIDMTALSVLDAQDTLTFNGKMPVRTTPDGNCLFNAVSRAIFGNENMATELRLRTALELSLNPDYYRAHPIVSELKLKTASGKEWPLSGLYDAVVFRNSNLCAQHTTALEAKNTDKTSFQQAVEKEICSTFNNYAWSGIMQIMGLASAVRCNIQLLYPDKRHSLFPLLSGTYRPRISSANGQLPTITIMWTNIGGWKDKEKEFQVNHFVPILSVEERANEWVTVSKKRKLLSTTANNANKSEVNSHHIFGKNKTSAVPIISKQVPTTIHGLSKSRPGLTLKDFLVPHHKKPSVNTKQPRKNLFKSKSATTKCTINQAATSSNKKRVHSDTLIQDYFCASAPKKPERTSVAIKARRTSITQKPKRVSVSQEPERVSVLQVPERASILQEPECASLSQEPERASVLREPERVFVPQVPDCTSVSPEPDCARVSQVHERVSVSQEPERVSVPQEPERASISQEPGRVSVPQDPERSSVLKEPERVRVSQVHERVSVSQKTERVFVPQLPESACILQKSEHVSVPQEPERVSVSQDPERVSVPQELSLASVSQEPESVSASQEPERNSLPKTLKRSSVPQGLEHISVLEHSARAPVQKKPKVAFHNISQEFVLPLKGVDRLFYRKRGELYHKNAKRNQNNKNRIGKRILKCQLSDVKGTLKENVQTLKHKLSSSGVNIASQKGVIAVGEYILKNGPLIQTTELCKVYNEGKGSSNGRRMMAAELYGIISKYLCVMQIYIEGIAFTSERITGNFEGLMSFINGNSLNHQKLVNDKVEVSVGSCFKQALQYMDTKRDRDTATAIMERITSVKFVTGKLLDVKNKRAVQTCRDMLKANLNRYEDIKFTSQVVRNDMTNENQYKISLRIANKRKSMEILHIAPGRGRILKCEENQSLVPLLEYAFMESDVRDRGGGRSAESPTTN